MPMKKKFFGGGWVADVSGWGLVDARTGKPINPIELVTDEKIEVTQWELQDFAVQAVRDQLEKDGYQLMSWQGNPDVDPAIWFVGKSKKPEWVVVRAVRYPERDAVQPANWDAIAAGCAHMSQIGHFASVAFASMDDPFDPSGANVVPLYRGHGTHVRYEGLDRVVNPTSGYPKVGWETLLPTTLETQMVSNKEEYKKYFEAYESLSYATQVGEAGSLCRTRLSQWRRQVAARRTTQRSISHGHHDSLIQYLWHVGIHASQLTHVGNPRWNIVNVARDKASRKEVLKKLGLIHLDPKASVDTDTGERQFDDKEKADRPVSVRTMSGGKCSGR